MPFLKIAMRKRPTKKVVIRNISDAQMSYAQIILF